jgi:hypothetical protein
MSPEDKSTEEAQATETAKEMADTAKQDTAAEATAKPDTGMIGVEADREIPATDSSEDTPIEALQKPLFDEVAPSEAELTGVEEETATPEKKEEGEGEVEESEKATKEEKASTEEPAKETEEKPAEETKASPEKPPAGYVPWQALRDERDLVVSLREELATMKAEAEKDTEDTFKVLSDEELKELAEDDPVEAVMYQNRLNKHLREQQEKEAKQEAQREQSYADEAVINQSFERMEKAVPGLLDKSNPINQELTQFAVDNGFEPDYIAAMTAPGTLILPAGAKNPVLLGPGAAGLVGMIYKLHSTLKENDPETLRAQIKAKVEKELTQTITEQLIKKFKSPAGGEEFKSIGEVPGGPDEVPDVSGGFTEAQYANMSPEQRDKLLGA